MKFRKLVNLRLQTLEYGLWGVLFKASAAACLLLFATGCSTINVTKCIVTDTPSNRVVVSNIVTTVAINHGFWVSQPKFTKDGGVDVVADFVHWGKQRPQIDLGAYAGVFYHGKIYASLHQRLGRSKRSPFYLEVQNDLVVRFKERFCNGVEFDIHNEQMPP